MTRRAVVTGGAGFLGSHLVDALVLDSWNVVVVDDLSTGSSQNLTKHIGRPYFEMMVTDVCSEWTVDGRVDLILNFACAASPKQYTKWPIKTLHTGSVGTQNVIELALEKGARLVHASTSEVYGDPLIHPQPESYWGNVNPIGPRSTYDESKRYAEALIAAHVRAHGLDAGIVRIFNTYGPRLSPGDGRVVSNFVRQALTEASLTIFGDGTQTRSFCYIDDMVRGIINFAQLYEQVGPVNLGNQEEISIAELAAVVCDITGIGHSVVYRPLPVDDPIQRCPDLSRARDLLNWNPEIGLRDGLKHTVDWFQSSLQIAK
ncbi:UDP-glucose 4-epimerase [Mycobacterium marinum]|uniref:UDP-glucose 4-epimerase n=1 Tax=Mycobacterium marinum TaxID=1781 RepID=A0A3E2MZF1_MYCMR|nr:NAD-dependent epimerase/dehydratase family protein [Mycobacterium marinum]AXN43575.1 UDP-glucose 4-epimerase [Mycobacterium marinum]AXN48940.1 UDP-glucose 4-epimerase [Mycobacterium marinum]EPQ79224.1 dTDP-glucose 4,6-dehydratase [Mycobacterium marinum str. Europe]RFZ04970.1 UDP-glucose 4-epimerase [Mycobacterium marinum]RFZ12290.1 UDP-glucose 4-epimerase [Mycobacterium marinum]